MASKQQQADQEFDPKYEWQENAANFLLRLHLSGFRKEDFRVQVDGAGRLTVRGQRADAGKNARFHKVFQLPPTSDLDNISGRFDAAVLTLTVPKRPAPPPATIDDIRRKPDNKPKETTKTPLPQLQEQHKEEEEIDKKQAKQDKAEQHKEEEAIHKKSPKQDKAEQRKEAILKPKEEEVRKKAAAAHEQIKERVAEAAKTSTKPPEQQQKAETKPPHPQAAADQDKESLLERVRRRAEEDRAKAAAAEEAQRQRLKEACGGWKQRVAEELHGLRTSQWAEAAVDTVKKNKEVIAAAVAAFSLGLFVSARLCSKRN